MHHSAKKRERRKEKARGAIGVGLLVVAGCGDANTNDNRGYTKAPLEKPAVMIRAEGRSAMDSLGTPILPRDTVFPVPPAAAAPAAQPKQ